MPSAASIAKPAWIQSSTDNRLWFVLRTLPISRSLRPARPAKTDVDVTSEFPQEYDSQRRSDFLACWSHVLLLTHNRNFSVRSSAVPGTVERARPRSKASGCGVEWRSVIVGGSALRPHAVTGDGWNCAMRFVDKIRGHWA